VSKGNLYLIPSPIEQNSTKNFLISHQHEEIKKIKHFFVENHKTARAILKKLELNSLLQEIVFFETNQNTNLSEIDHFIEPIYTGHHFGLISDSGLPCIADPGNIVVSYAHKHNIQIKPLIGPSSIFLSLMASGFNGQNFEFVGYLPIDLNEKKKKLVSFQECINTENKTFIFIETPYRNNKLLGELINILNNNTRLCIAYNLTANDEKISSKKVADWKKNNLPILDKKPCIFLIN
jgi:16S rRNA (cytidine1402-2'-O)-methyltransferase